MQTYKENSELLHSQTNADQINKENSSTEELIERHQIEGTPFWRIRQNGQYNIVMGQYLINPIPLNDIEAVENYLYENTYNILFAMLHIINQINSKNQQP